MTRSKDKGTAAETAVVTYLRGHGFPYAERRALHGAMDKGDVSGTPGVCWEVKVAGRGYRIGTWLKELDAETANSGSDVGLLVCKPAGMGVATLDYWVVVMRAEAHEMLLGGSFKRHRRFEVAGAPTRIDPVAQLRGVYKALWDELYPPQQASRFRSPSFRGYEMELSVPTDVYAAYKPYGVEDNWKLFYRFMYLKHACTLLHENGYGVAPS